MYEYISYKTVNKQNLLELIDKAIETVYSGGDWNSIFPNISGYNIFSPEGHGDMEEYPDSFRGADHAIAHQSVKYTELHPKIAELVKIIMVGNVIHDDVILASIFEHAGTHYAVELALVDKKYIKNYAEFLMTNNMYYERFQRFDFVSVVRKWGWHDETYYLLFAYMLLEGEYFDEDLKYLNFNEYSLQEKMLDNKEEEDKFLDSLCFFLREINHEVEDEEQNKFMENMFGELVKKHIYSDNPVFPEEKERSEKLRERFPEIIEKLKNEYSPPEIELSNKIEEEITLDEEDLPEI